MSEENKQEVSFWKRFILKITSVKTILLIFINVMLALIILNKMFEFKELAYIILGADVSYFGINVWQKKVESRCVEKD